MEPGKWHFLFAGEKKSVNIRYIFYYTNKSQIPSIIPVRVMIYLSLLVFKIFTKK